MKNPMEDTSLLPQTITIEESSREKRDRKIETFMRVIDKKIEISLELWKKIQSITLEMLHEEVERELTEFKNTLLSQKIDPDTLIAHDTFFDSEDFTKERDPFEKNPLYTNEIALYNSMDLIIYCLINKNKKIKEHELNVTFFIQEQTEFLPEAIEKCTIDPFSVTFYINADIWNKEKGKWYYGFHQGNYIFLSNGNPEDIKKQTLQHEKVHNVLAYSRFHNLIRPDRYIKAELERYNAQKEIVTVSGKKIDLPKIPNTTDLINILHQEILADLDIIKKETAKIDQNELLKMINQDYFESIGFAGGYYYDTYCALRAGIEKFPELKKTLNEIADEFQKKTDTLFYSIAKAYQCVKILDTGAEEKLDMFFTVMKPTQYHHVFEWLCHLYPEKKEGLKEIYKPDDLEAFLKEKDREET